MITLRPLEAHEFPAFAAYFIPDYAAEIVANFGITLDRALTQAAQDLAKDLPQGADTPGEDLMAITLTDTPIDTPIGYLFYTTDAATNTAFIKDFHILPPHQSQGFGSAAMAALIDRLKLQGITQLRLRVAASNPAAHRLYSRLGFFPTGTNMAKIL